MKWDNLKPIDLPPGNVRRGHLRRIMRGVREIMDRTGASAWWDTVRAAVCFGYYNADGTCRLVDVLVPLYRDRERLVEAGFDPQSDRFTVDQVIGLVRLARIPVAVKERWARESAAKRVHDRREWLGKLVQESQETGRKIMEREYTRHSMGRHHRPMITVP